MQPKTPMIHAAAIDLSRCFAESDRQRGLSRRSQAMLAAAGMEAPARRWFVVTVDHGFDRGVAETLAFADVEVWVPSVDVKPRRRGGMTGKRDIRGRLAVPGYVFAKVAATVAAWGGLSGIKGVSGILGSNGRPLPVEDHNVALFRAYLADDPEAIATITNAVRLGDRVMVENGPFRSFPGMVEALDKDSGRAIVEILVFGRLTPVRLDIAQLSKL